MTYLEKLRMAIKVDREILSAQRADMLECYISETLIRCCCPGSHFPGAPRPSDDCICPFDGGCRDCWNQEIEADACV